MDRKEYNICMKPYMTGGGPERKQRFCIGAKLCSGKSKTEDEAKLICSQPKAAKAPKLRRGKRGQSCEKSSQKVAECIVNKLVDSEVYRDQALNINSVGSAITNALIECQCPRQ